jgi:hypothetical protein
MRRLSSTKGVVPRAYPDHRRREARRYRDYVENIQQQWGPLSPVALEVAKEAGRITVELERLSVDLEAATARKRRRDIGRIRRAQTTARAQRLHFERRIEELVATQGRKTSFAAAVRAAS